MAEDFPDTLTQDIGVLKRREVEARILAPVVAALGEKFGREAVTDIVRDVIVRLAREGGAAMAAQYGDSVKAFEETLQFWTMGGALEIEVQEQNGGQLDYDITRCKYAEMYQALGIPELGVVLSCNRDFAMVEGFNPKTTLTREETILGGGSRCTFRYKFPESGEKP